MSTVAQETYRDLVYRTPGFTDYFFASTPIREIAGLNIGSRPASRKSNQRIEDLRAIPWGFSWAQCRLILTRSEEHTSELQSIMRISYAVFCLKKKKTRTS